MIKRREADFLDQYGSGRNRQPLVCRIISHIGTMHPLLWDKKIFIFIDRQVICAEISEVMDITESSVTCDNR